MLSWAKERSPPGNCRWACCALASRMPRAGPRRTRPRNSGCRGGCGSFGSTRMPRKALAFFLAAAAWFAASAPAQETVAFGQNKVQYHSFHWRYYQTKHFDIYYPQGGERLAEFAARHVEEMH